MQLLKLTAVGGVHELHILLTHPILSVNCSLELQCDLSKHVHFVLH